MDLDRSETAVPGASRQWSGGAPGHMWGAVDLNASGSAASFRSKHAASGSVAEGFRAYPATVSAVLAQVLPSLTVADRHATGATTKTSRRHLPSPQFFKRWKGFVMAARKHAAPSAPVAEDVRADCVPIPSVAKGVGREADIWAALRVNVCTPLTHCLVFGEVTTTIASVAAGDAGPEASVAFALASSASDGQPAMEDAPDTRPKRKQEASGSTSGAGPNPKRVRMATAGASAVVGPHTGAISATAPRVKRPRAVVGEPDMVSYRSGGIVTSVVEAKTPWSVEYLPNSSADLVKQFGETKPAPFRRLISQLCGYMLDNNVAFGAITTYQRTWFVHAEFDVKDRTVTFKISDAVCANATRPTALQVWGYFLSLAHEAAPLFPSKIEADATAGAPTPSFSLPAGLSVGLQFVPWKDIYVSSVLGRGRCGSVAICRREGSGSAHALKMFDISKPRGSERFLAEITAYAALTTLQGHCVPSLLFWTESVSGNVLGLGLELCDALPHEFSEWSGEQRRQALTALRRMARRGVGHGDVRAENFCVNSAGNVVALDLEDVISLRNVPDTRRKRYLRDLNMLFESNTM